MELSQEALRAEIKNGPVGPYFLYGSEEYLKSFYTGRIRAHIMKGAEDFAEWNTREIDATQGDNFKIAELYDALSAVPMMSEKVFVLYSVKLTPPKEKEEKKDKADQSATEEEQENAPAEEGGAQVSGGKGKENKKSAKEIFNGRVEELLATVEGIDKDSVCLVVTVTDGAFDAGMPEKGKPTALYKKLEKTFNMVGLNTPTPKEISDWLARRIKHEGIAMTAEAAEYYKSRAAEGMFALGGEIDKTICFARARGREVIDMELVSEVTSLLDVSEQYGLANAIANGDRKKALGELYLSKKRAEAPQMILGGVIANITLMLTVKAMADAGVQQKDIAEKLHANPYRIAKIMEGIRGTEYGKIRGALNRLTEADRARKSTGLDDVLALERFICTIPSGKK